ncbi:MAG: BamA/TamA family outer membrane protein [Candidatus Aminicenantes bacterium]|nr:MAG: BamA/TamA family outer membrane protein [Candidatus Aminicenantes bacterium]
MKQEHIKIKTSSPGRRVPLLLVVLLVLMAAMPVEMFPQYQFWYGKNKVQKGFKWDHVETDHFKIYYYTNQERLIKKVAGAAEHAYKRISDYLNVQVEKRKIPLIFYNTKIDFELTNIVELPQIFSPEAFAQSTTYRVVVQGETSFEDLARTIAHELGHIFEYEIMGARTMYIRPPQWVMEGFPEFMAGTWNPFALLTVRDSVLYGRIPQMTKLGRFQAPFSNARLLYYDYGHILFEFLDKKLGKRSIKKLLYALKGSSILTRGGGNILRVLDYTPKVFNHEFGKYLRERFAKFVTKEDPEDYSYIIGPDFPLGGAISTQISPSGEVLAVFTLNLKAPDLDIMLISMKDGKVIKNITPGGIFGPRYDIINFPYEPADGNAFVWNKESDQIAFFARKEWTNYLVVMDVLKGKILKKIKLKNIQKATSPRFHPNLKENKLYFTGQEATKAYLYCMDLHTNKVSKLTDGFLFIKAFDISPQGTRLIYSAKSEEYYKLYMGTLDNPDMARQITFGDYNDITPSFSGDSRYVYYSSDERESYNIYKIDLYEKMLYRYTDVKTGNFYPMEIPEEKDQVVMTSFYKGGFTLFKKDISTPQEERKIEFEDVDRELLAKKEAEQLKKVDIQYRGKYKPMSKLFIQSLPPLGVSIGTDGALWGYSYLNLSDLMGDHNFIFQFSSFYGYRSYHMIYLNQKRRLQLFTHLYSSKDSYYYNYNYAVINPYDRRNYRTLREQHGGEVGFWYPFNRSYRLEATASFYKQIENLDNIYLGTDLPYGQFVNGWAVPLRVSLVGDTILFMGYGPNRGHTFKFTFEKYFGLGDNFIDAYAFEGDFRKYFRLDNNTLLALRLFGFKSGGKTPLLFWTGGNNTIRSVGFWRLTGDNMFLFNAEFRFPLLHQAWSLIGPLGPIRGVFFFDLGGVWFSEQKFRFFQEGRGIALETPIASYGFGLQFFFLGYPMHLEWVWRTDLRRRAYYGINFWIGFDF